MKLKSGDFVFVAIQFVLFILYFFDIDDWFFNTVQEIKYIALVLLGIGILIFIISLLQLNKNLSPFPSPKSNAQLIQNGIYKYIRHPIYTGLLLITFGFTLYIGSLFKFVVCIALFTLFYYKSLYEEQKLIAVFPDYLEYKKYTGRFIPKLR